MTKFVEIRKGDVIVFNSKSGTGSFVNLKNKGIYFMPAKKETRLDGQKFPIKRNEAFIFSGYELLEAKGSTRTTKIILTRVITNQTCFISEYYLHKYFSKPENSSHYVQFS
jgi:hypothetical protein